MPGDVHSWIHLTTMSRLDLLTLFTYYETAADHSVDSEEWVLCQLYSYKNCASAPYSNGSTVDSPCVKSDICPDSH